jgi:tetratricopeptide (TPR) repeat protein
MATRLASGNWRTATDRTTDDAPATTFTIPVRRSQRDHQGDSGEYFPHRLLFPFHGATAGPIINRRPVARVSKIRKDWSGSAKHANNARASSRNDIRAQGPMDQKQKDMHGAAGGRIDTQPVIAAAERYERGLTLKKAGRYTSAIEQFEDAALAPEFALRAYAKIGLCYTSSGRNEEAVTAFQKALKASARSRKETIQILYVLGRTLESLGRTAETLEAYRWVRREDAQFRDVGSRIEQLTKRRSSPAAKEPVAANASWVTGVLKSWQYLFKQRTS